MKQLIYKMVKSRKAIIAFLFSILLGAFFVQTENVKRLQAENKAYKNNTSALMESAEHYKIQDSLSAVKVKSLELTAKEYKKYRAENATIIKKLKADKITNVSSVATNTKAVIRTVVRDSIIYRTVHDSVYVEKLKAINYSTKWVSVNGYVKGDSIKLNIHNNEELILSESITRKKFLFFKLPIWLFGYKNKVLNVVSKNPNTTIQNVEYINFR